MSFVISQSGQLKFLQAITNSDTLQLHLYVNNWMPSKTDTLVNYQELVSVGYGPKSLIPGNWTFVIDPILNNWVASYNQQTWPFNYNVTVYGYYITDSTNAVLLIAELFPTAPVTLLTTGGNIVVTPTLGLQ
jgi:hypothetical protein